MRTNQDQIFDDDIISVVNGWLQMLCEKRAEIFNNNIARERTDKRFKQFC